MRRDQVEGGGAGPSREPSTDQEQGSGDSSHSHRELLNNPLLQLFLNSCFSDCRGRQQTYQYLLLLLLLGLLSVITDSRRISGDVPSIQLGAKSVVLLGL